jgi:hypothetical protein
VSVTIQGYVLLKHFIKSITFQQLGYINFFGILTNYNKYDI